jgi:ubiquitin conjugation factor E4 B
VNHNALSSDGFLVNLHAVLLRFVEPFMGSHAEIDRIDADYLTTSTRLSLDAEARINATTSDLRSHAAELAITESST